MSEADPYQTLFNDQVAARGGLERLSNLDTEIISIICRLLISVRTADAADVPKMAASVAQLTATLPSPPAADEDNFRLERLTDDELSQLAALQAKCCDQTVPLWKPEEPIEREVGASERVGAALGRWIDERKHNWHFGSPTEVERIHMRNEFGAMGYPIITRNLWADIYRADMQSEIEKAVRNALAAVGRDDVKLIPSAPEEPKRIDFHDHPLAPLKNRDGT